GHGCVWLQGSGKSGDLGFWELGKELIVNRERGLRQAAKDRGLLVCVRSPSRFWHEHDFSLIESRWIGESAIGHADCVGTLRPMAILGQREMEGTPVGQ